MKRNGAIVLMVLIIIITSCSIMAFGQEQTKQKDASQVAPLFSVARMVVATDIQDREPVGVSETFPVTTEKVYCFLEAKDIAADVQVSFVWYHEGKEVHTYTLPLGQGPKWRTFSSKNLYGKKGTWKVELKDSAGNTVRTSSFKIE